MISQSKLATIFTLLGALVICAALGELTVRILAIYLPNLNYLATAGSAQTPPLMESLEDYVAYKHIHLAPHRRWRGYWNNSLGFNDIEFQEKKSSKLRIAALGDSYAYGQVPYPDNLLTVAERVANESLLENPESAARLRTQEKRTPIELYNFGVAASGVWDYLTIYRLISKRYQPDLVLINFYMGNDGGDALHHFTDIPQPPALHSALYTFLKNLMLLYRGLKPAQLWRGFSQELRGGLTPEGGLAIPDEQSITDQSPELSGPFMSEIAYQETMESELGQLLKQTKPSKEWANILSLLTELLKAIKNDGKKAFIVLIPSRIQLDQSLRDKTVERVRQKMQQDLEFDVNYPVQLVCDVAQQAAVPCLSLLPELADTFGSHSSTVGPSLDARSAVTPSAATLSIYFIERDTHWNIRGNKVGGEILGKHLAKYLHEKL